MDSKYKDRTIYDSGDGSWEDAQAIARMKGMRSVSELFRFMVKQEKKRMIRKERSA